MFANVAKPAVGAVLGYARLSKGTNTTTRCRPRRSGPPVADACSRRGPLAGAGTARSYTASLTIRARATRSSLDRLSRLLKDVLHIMERIGNADAGLRSITENIDTTTPAGGMVMQVVGAFAEFERAMIRERTSAGLAAARAEGRVGGCRRKLEPAKRLEIAESVIAGRKSAADMARLYNVSQPTVSRIVAQHRGDTPTTGLST
jgi:Resolvase, N terminal domain